MPEPLNPCHPEQLNPPQGAGDIGGSDVAALGRKLFDLRIKCLELDLDWKTVDFAAKAIAFLERRHTEMQRTTTEQLLALRAERDALRKENEQLKSAPREIVLFSPLRAYQDSICALVDSLARLAQEGGE